MSRVLLELHKYNQIAVKMAEKGNSDNLSYSQMNATDEFHELCCTRCANKKKNKPAVKYCLICGEYFCHECLETHNSFQTMRIHPMRDTKTDGQSSRTAVDKVLAVPTEFCPHHPMKLIDMYCETDEAVGCSVCFNLDHKFCEYTHYIPQYVQERNSQQHINNIHEDLTKTVGSIHQLETDCEKVDTDYEKSKAACKEDIDQYRKEINDAIDKIEERTLAELETKYKRGKQAIIENNKTIKDIKSNVTRYLSDLVSEQVNLAQKFVLAILSKTLLKRSKDLNSRSTVNQTPTTRFSRNTDILAFLLNVLTLGVISSPANQDTMDTSSRDKQTSQPTSTPTTTTTTGATGSSIDTGNVRKVSQKSKKQGLYKVVNKSEYNIKQSDDRNTCSTWSSCIVDDSCIALVDFKNSKLKLVDSKSYNIISSLVFDAVPMSVCRVDSGEVVVCLGNKTIQFISYKDKLVVTRTLSMEHNCTCIAISNNRLFVASYSKLYIYSIQGKLLKFFTEIQSGNKIFSNIRDVTISDDQSMIHIVDWRSGVITLDMNGKICWEFSDKVLDGAWGVCTDGLGNVLVCGVVSSNVIMLGQCGDYIGEIVTRQYGLSTMCYDKNRNTLIVDYISNITVFSLQ